MDAEGGQSLAKALPLSSSGLLRTALGFRPLGFNDGEEDSDSLNTSGEYALADPGKPRCEKPYENGAALRHKGRTRLEALALMPWALGHLGLDGQAIHIWAPC